MPLNQIPLQKVGEYLGCDAYSVTMQYIENIETSSKVIKFPTIGSAPFGQPPIMLCTCQYGRMVGHNIDRCIMYVEFFKSNG